MKIKSKLLLMLLSLILIITMMPQMAFADGGDLTEDSVSFVDGDFEFETSYGYAYITKYNGTATDLTLPDTAAGYPVDGIRYVAFKDTTTIKTLVIPEGYEHIESHQFYNCSELKTVSLPSTLGSIGAYVFFNNPLTKVTYNGTVESFKNLDIVDME